MIGNKLISIFLCLLWIISCSPEQREHNLEPTEVYFKKGPEGTDLPWAGGEFVESQDAYKSFSGELDSSTFFESLKNLFYVDRHQNQELESLIYRLSYKLYLDAFDLESLQKLLNQGEAKQNTQKIQETISLIRERKFYSLKTYREILSNHLEQALRKDLQLGKRADLLYELAKSLEGARIWNTESSLRLEEKLKKVKYDLESSGDPKLPLSYQEDLKAIFKLLERKNKENQALNDKAVALQATFYENAKNYSKVAPQDSPYLEAALGLYGGDLYQVWATRIQEISSGLESAFAKVKISISEPKTDEEKENPENVVLQLNQELSTLGERLKEQGVNALVVDQVDAKVRNLQPVVRFAVSNLKDMDMERELGDNIRLFSEVLRELEATGLFSEKLLSRIRSEIDFPADIGDYIALIREHSSDLELQKALGQSILVKIWRYQKDQLSKKIEQLQKLAKEYNCEASNLNQEAFATEALANNTRICEEVSELSGYFGEFKYYVNEISKVFGGNRRLVQAFYYCSEKDLQWLSRVSKDKPELDDSFWDYINRPLLSIVSTMIYDYIEEVGVGPFLGSIEKGVNRALLHKLSLRLSQELSQFDGIIFRQITNTLSKMDSDWTGNFYQKMKELGKTELKHRLMKSDKDLRMLEAKRVKLFYQDSKWVVANANLVEGGVRTGALGITEALNSGILSIWASQGGGTSENASLVKGFEMINKAVSMVGTRNYYGELMPALSMNWGEGIPRLIDIYTYGYEKDPVGIPEDFVVSKSVNYKLDSVMENREFSIENQASLLESGTLIMNLMADWSESPLDSSLHSLQYEGIDFFPKTSLVELGLGIGCLPLRNLYKGGLVLFDKDRHKLSFERDSIEEVASKVTSASVVNLSATQKGEGKVSLKSLARYMMALYDFIETAEQSRLSRSNTALVISKATGETQWNELNRAMAGLKKLYIAMANFMSTRFLTEDKLFFSEYDMDLSQAVVGEISVEDQFYAQMALLRAYKLWDAEIYLSLAQDNLFSLNRKYLNVQMGTYPTKSNWKLGGLALSFRALSEWTRISQEKFHGNAKLLKTLVDHQRKLLLNNL